MRRQGMAGVIVLALLAGAAEGRAATVQGVRVQRQGGGVLDTNAVLAFTSVKTGTELSRAALSRDVKALEKTGRFTYVGTSVETMPGGVEVVYVVKPKPRIRRLEITGADEIGNKKIKELLDIGAGDLVDDATLSFKSLAVKDHYQKHFYPDVRLTWDILQDPLSGQADVRIRVQENKRSRVEAIEFPGRTSVPRRVLRKAMKQKRHNFLSWITGAGVYKPEELAEDREVVRKIYLDRGYLDAQVGDPLIAPAGRRSIAVNLPVTEGQQYHLGQLRVSGVTLFPEADVRRAVTNRTAALASMAALEKDRQGVRDYYGSRGYIDSEVRLKLKPDLESHVVDVDYDVSEGKLAYIRNINIRGNDVTKDRVIRRELSVYPGEIYNEVKVRTSERRLRNLGYFSYVNAVPESTQDPEKYDLAFEVEEQKTGQFLVGVGFSSVDDLIGFAELSQGNFDLFGWPPSGGGQKLKLRGTIGTKRTDIELSFVEPWFLNRKLSLGVDLFQRERRFLSDDYDQKNTGANITLGKPLGSFSRVNLIYGLENIEVFNVDTNASDLIKQEEGTQLKSSLTLEVIRDTRDSAFVPTRGLRSSISAMTAGGPLGGDTQIYGFEGQASQYIPVWFDHVLNLKGWMSFVDNWGDSDHVPIFDRLFLGGARTLRGFKYRDVGPKDENGESIGGSSAWYATVEYGIPIVDKFRVAVFYDVGMVYEDAFNVEFSDPNSDVGVGLRVDFPGFPLRLDYAWPLQTDEFNDRSSGRFQFTIGYSL